MNSPLSEFAACKQQADKQDKSLRPIFASFCREADAQGLPGGILLVSQAGRTNPAFVTYGRRCADEEEPLSISTPFPIASLTKSGTALLVLDLIDKEAVALDTYLNSGNSDGATLEQRLRHEFQPGSLWHYDNANYAALGEWIDREEPGRFIKAWHHRFDKEGPRLSPSKEGACEHDWLDRRAVEITDNTRNSKAKPLADGGAYGSAQEVLALLGHIADEPRMFSDTIDTGEGDRYGLGLRVEPSRTDAHTTWGHRGATRGSWSWMRGDNQGTRAVLLVNRNLALEETVALLRTQLFDLAPFPQVELLEPAELTGDFGVRGWSQVVTFRLDKDTLRMDAPEIGSFGVELRPQGRNRYSAHLPGTQGASTLVFVSHGGDIWLRTPWFVGKRQGS